MGKPTYTDVSDAAAKAFAGTVDQLVMQKLGPIAGLTTNATFADDKFSGTHNAPNVIPNGPSLKI